MSETRTESGQRLRISGSAWAASRSGTAKPHNFAPGGFHLLDLLDRLFHLARVRLGHGLHRDGGISADGKASDLDRAGLSPGREEFLITEIQD